MKTFKEILTSGEKGYSQHGEDLFLIEYIQKHNINIPKSVIDIGALTGLHNSNSRLFSECEWDCIMIEPNPESFKLLKKNTANLKCFLENVAISDVEGEFSFEVNRNCAGHSKLKEDGKIKVKAITLKTLFEKYPTFKHLGVLDIDVEGHEEIILVDLFKTDVRPSIIIVEHQLNPERIERQKEILNHEYDLIHSVSVNNIWLKKKYN